MKVFGKFKIVDIFNGWEGDEFFDDMEEALKKRDRMAEEFFAQPGNQNAFDKRRVVPSHVEWFHNGRKWIWG
jgi:hypothetical protein